jgi:hypothetical protein
MSLKNQFSGGVMIKIKKVAHHRNGVSGTPFHVVTFSDRKVKIKDGVAIVFDETHYVAVLDLNETLKGNIEFGQGNSWRGDDFEKSLREAIRGYETSRTI